MPEIIILISAVACVGSAVVLYFHRSNAAAAGVTIISFIACLYGVGQRMERDNVDGRSLGFGSAADRRAAQDASINDGAMWRQRQAEADARDKAKKVAEPAVIRRQAEVIPDDPAKLLPLSPPTQLNAFGSSPPTVIISSFTSKVTANKYVEISGRVVNTNEFAIKNVVVKCGDKTFASADVSAKVDKIVPAKSDLYVAGLRMGPINVHLPPTTCLIAKFDRAD